MSKKKVTLLVIGYPDLKYFRRRQSSFISLLRKLSNIKGVGGRMTETRSVFYESFVIHTYGIQTRHTYCLVCFSSRWFPFSLCLYVSVFLGRYLSLRTQD